MREKKNSTPIKFQGCDMISHNYSIVPLSIPNVEYLINMRLLLYYMDKKFTSLIYLMWLPTKMKQVELDNYSKHSSS